MLSEDNTVTKLKKGMVINMANKETPHDTDLMRPVDFWRDRLNIYPAAHAGVTMQEGWVDGKFVTEGEYKAALEQFLHGSIEGRKEIKNA